MKKLLLILSLFVVCANYAQLTMNTELEPYVLEFVNDCEERGINGMGIIMQLKGIYYVELEENTAGGYTKEGYILLDPSLTDDQLKATLYHEIGHLYGLPHSCEYCSDVMSACGFLGDIDYEKFFNKLKK